MVFSEDSRVKIPCILHLVRLGYRYLSLKNCRWYQETNIFPDLFRSAIAKINPGIAGADIDRLLTDVRLLLDNEDLGKAFYDKLTERSGIKLIDFANFANNSFHVVTELTCKNGDDEFRPDITLLINGLPLVFIEVKKPNNREGVLAERNRIITRSRNTRFRRFINITQLMVFSNNMEYDDGTPQPIEGAFYASPSYDAPSFNYFREEETLNLADLLANENDALENEVLRDNNLNVIKHSPEFISNKSPDTPTNRICTSLFSRDRLSFLLQYGLVYVNDGDVLHKHVMRYPQLFATKAIERKLDAGTPYDLSGNQGNKFITRGAQDVSDEGIKDASLKKHPAGTVLLSSRAPIGYMAIARIELTTNQGFKSFIPTSGYSTAFIYYTVKNALKVITQYASGSTFKEVSGSVLKTVKITLPKSDIIGQFSNTVESLFRRQDLLEQENQHLIQLRDWLLPMLMNGQVTVA